MLVPADEVEGQVVGHDERAQSVNPTQVRRGVDLGQGRAADQDLDPEGARGSLE